MPNNRKELSPELLEGLSQKEKDIISFFQGICEGIRREYENGASTRSLDEDIKTLKSLLIGS